MSSTGRSKVRSSKTASGNGKICAEIEVLSSRIDMLEKSIDALKDVSNQISGLAAQVNSIKADLSRLILHVENPASADKSLIVRIRSVEDKLSSIEAKLAAAGDFARQVGVRLVVYFIAGSVSGGVAIAMLMKALGH